MEALPLPANLSKLFRGNDSPYSCGRVPISEAQLKGEDTADAPPITFTTPYERSGDYVALPTLLNGQKMRLLFDTGGGFSIALNKSASKKLSLKPLGASIVRGVSGKEASTEARADTMTIGPESFRAIPIDILGGDVGSEDGVFGVSNFDHYAVTIDFTDKKITLARGKNAVAPVPLPGRQAMTLPFHDLGGDIIAGVNVEGREVWALVDTGADGDLILSLENGAEYRRQSQARRVGYARDYGSPGPGKLGQEAEHLVFPRPGRAASGRVGRQAVRHPHSACVWRGSDRYAGEPRQHVSGRRDLGHQFSQQSRPRHFRLSPPPDDARIRPTQKREKRRVKPAAVNGRAGGIRRIADNIQ